MGDRQKQSLRTQLLQTQTARRQLSLARRKVARIEARRQAQNRQRLASTQALETDRDLFKSSLLVFIPFFLCIGAFLLYSQVQIGRVLLSGVQTQGTVVVGDHCSHSAETVTVAFTDTNGATHRVRHTNFTIGCPGDYYVGESVSIRYVPSDPGVLMTGPEMSNLWDSLIMTGLGDVVTIVGVGGSVSLGVLPWLSRRRSALRARARA
jgi:hypothetical protein